MVIAINADERREYVVEADRGEDNPTVFHLRFLTAAERAHLEDGGWKMHSQSQEIHMCSGALRITAIQAGLEDWDNFKDEDGNDVPFKRSKKSRTILGRDRFPVDPKLIDRLPAEVMNEVAEAIIEGLTLSLDERKNS